MTTQPVTLTDLNERIQSTARMVRSDIAADVDRHEGMAFNGRNVGEALGELSAAVDAAVGMIAALSDALAQPTPDGGK